jgi:mono/diheme cytochrome c family protein
MAPLRLWFWFAAASVFMVVTLSISPVRHVFPEWKSVQNEYNRLAAERYRMGQDVRTVRLGLRQIWNPRLGVVDRCTTCHLGIEQPALRDAAEPFRSHPTTPHKLGEIGCTICHRGQGRATTARAAHGKTRHWESPMLPTYYVSGSCGSCHRERRPPEARTVSEGRRLIERSSCASCHVVRGFALHRQPGADLSAIGSKVRPEWLYRWLKQPFDYLPKSRMPDFHLSDAEARTLTSYLLTFRDSELEALAGSPLESSLVNAGAEEVDHGESRYREARCVSCHSQDGRGGVLGPEVGKISAKVKPIWLDAWIGEPRKLFADSTMPQFGFTVRDRHAVVSYMLSEFVDYESDVAETEEILASLPKPDDSVMAEGERLYRLYGCGQCHRLRGVETRGEFGTDLSAEGIKDIDQLDFGSVDIEPSLVDWLYTKVKSPRVFAENLKMPDYHFTQEEARQVTAALLSLTGDSVPLEHLPPQVATPVFRPGGAFGRVVEKYQCFTCHRVRGAGGDIAPDLTREGSMAKPEWLARYFDLPYTLRPIMTERMPNLGMSQEEIRTTVAYLRMVMVDDSVPEEIFDSPPGREMLESGRRLFYEKYACQACHQANQKGGYVGPPLDGVRDHLFSGYIYEWLLDPQRFVPETMDPNQGMTPDEATAITAFLYSLPAAGGAK